MLAKPIKKNKSYYGVYMGGTWSDRRLPVKRKPSTHVWRMNLRTYRNMKDTGDYPNCWHDERLEEGLTSPFPRWYGYKCPMVYPGQTVWVVVRDFRTNQLKVVKDMVIEVTQAGQTGTGHMINYWLEKYGNGHGLFCHEDFFLNKNEAINALKKGSCLYINYRC